MGASGLGDTQHSYRNYRSRITRIIVSGIAPCYFACNTLKRLAMMRVSRRIRIIYLLEKG
jgi:hypothetical protein